MVDHFGDLTYVHLIIITSQEETLSGNQPFKDRLPHLDLELKDIIQKMGYFSEQPFISEIEDANQNIKFCGVGYHHKNAIVERKFKL